MKSSILTLLVLLLFSPDYIYSVESDIMSGDLDSLCYRLSQNDSTKNTPQQLEIIQSCIHFNNNEISEGLHHASKALKYAREAGDIDIELLSLQMLCNGYSLQKNEKELSYYTRQLKEEQKQTIVQLQNTSKHYQVCCIILLIYSILLSGFVFYCYHYKRKSKQSVVITESDLSHVDEENNDEFDPIYTSIIQYVVTEKHYLDKVIDIAEVGKHCHISKELVNKVLSAKANMTLLELVNNHRLKHACSLLLDDSNKTVDAIADESGFKTTRTFLRQFKSRYNMLPSKYRSGTESPPY